MSPTTDRAGTQHVATPTGRHDLFGLPVWLVDLDLDVATVEHLVTDIDRCLAEHRLPDVPGQQTGSILHDRPEAHWQRFHRALLAATDRITDEIGLTWTSRFWRTWGLRFTGHDDYRAERWWVHCHQPATFSCAIVLTAPTALVSDPGGATVLRNPQANLAGITGADREWHGPARPGSGLVFPGPVEHHPEVPAPDLVWDRPRVLAVSDVCYL
jgi:hypothetical protein